MTSIKNKYTLKCTFAIEIQIDKLFHAAFTRTFNAN